MRHLDLFSGIGGFAIAALKTWGKEYENVGFCDIEPYAQNLLKIRFPGATIYGDIRELTAERIATDSELRGQAEQEQQTTGDKQCGGRVDILTGGFPCQPFSAAGKRKGTADDRFLWPEMLRVIKEVNPRWIIGENVGGLINMPEVLEQGGDIELGDEADNEGSGDGELHANGVLWNIITALNEIGYSVQCFVIPACAVGAPHRRDRIWIVAHSGHGYGARHEDKREYEKEDRQQATAEFKRPVERNDTGTVANSNSVHVRGRGEQNRKTNSISQEHRPEILSRKPCGADSAWIVGYSKSERYTKNGSVRQGQTADTKRTDRTDKSGIVAHTTSNGHTGGHTEAGGTERESEQGRVLKSARENRVDRHTESTGQQSSEHGQREGELWETGPGQDWLEVATEFCGVYDEISDWMDGHFNQIITEDDYGQTTTKDRTKNLSILREAISQEEVFKRLGGLFKVENKEVLFNLLFRIQNKPDRQNSISQQSQEKQSNGVSELWREAEFRRSPYRREYQEQFTTELIDIVPLLPYETALEVAKIWDNLQCVWASMISPSAELDGFKLSKAGHRVARLKGLGNAIVPQVAEVIMRAIK